MVDRSPPRSGPRHIKEILEALFRHAGIEQQIQASQALVCWSAVAGEEIAEHSRAATVERGTLFVEVENSVWMHRLQTQISDLKSRLNRELQERDPKSEPIREIRFRLWKDE